MKPYHHITLGNIPLKRETPNAESILLDLRVDLAMFQTNIARIVILSQTGAEANIGDEISIKLGDEETALVFTGEIQEVAPDIQHMEILAESRLGRIARTRVNKLYEQLKAGDIVSDFADQAGLRAASVQGGTEYASYGADAQSSHLEHSINLARKEGFDLYTNESDELVFAPNTGGQIHLLRYGAEILKARTIKGVPEADGVEVYGESPASLGQGNEAYSWLTKNEVKGSAGNTQGRIKRIIDPALKDVSSAGIIAENFFQQMNKSKRGKLTILGNPSIRLGDSITLSNFPQSRDNGTFQVTQVIHRLSKRKGYLTDINWEEI